MKRLSLEGTRFGRLVAIKYIDGKWKCRCDCGKEAYVARGNLRNGHTRSCGCLRDEAKIYLELGRAPTHGHGYKTPTYSSWDHMMQRCLNPNESRYKRYGGRGIKVCVRWRLFENFLSDLGERPAGTTLGRIDGDGHYEPGNVAWQTPLEQEQEKKVRRA